MLDLSDPQTNLRTFMRARASIDGIDSVTHFAGTVHAKVPGEAGRPLFGIEGYNIARAVEAEEGFDLLTREAVFYTDLRGGGVLERWTNPLTDEEVEVVHIYNDPVNQRLRPGRFLIPVTQMGDDVFFNLDIFLAYPSPLPRAEFPEHSQDDLYQAAELFQFFCKRADLEADTPSVPTQVSWTRLGPWLPWMRMGDAAGMLVYHCRGTKLGGGYADLPAWIRERVEATAQEFATAPTEFTSPNETSWTYFRKLLERTGSK